MFIQVISVTVIRKAANCHELSTKFSSSIGILTILLKRYWLHMLLVFCLFYCSFHFRANEEFNNAVVITSRCLKPNELLEVRVDIQVTKWAGSLEIGVTTHSPETLKFPSTMTNIEQPGTWMLSGGSIVCNGVTVIEEYGPTLDEIKVCYHICVFIKELYSQTGKTMNTRNISGMLMCCKKKANQV